MLDLLRNWLDLFRRGKLLADSAQFYRQLALGVGLTVFVFVAAAFLVGNVVVAALAGGLIGGLAQPYFFKDLRYR